jgi:hypothetical protein
MDRTHDSDTRKPKNSILRGFTPPRSTPRPGVKALIIDKAEEVSNSVG